MQVPTCTMYTGVYFRAAEEKVTGQRKGEGHTVLPAVSRGPVVPKQSL